MILFTIIPLLGVLLLVSPGIMVAEGQQQQGSSTSPQQPLPRQQPSGIPQQQVSNNTITLPILNDSRLEVELVIDGLSFPTSMEFIGNHGDMLILEKGGNVILFSNQSRTNTTILNFTVNESSERGLLGVAVASKNMSDPDITTTVSNETAIRTRDNNTNNTIESTSSSS